jgi:hypothetical protein
VRAQTAGAPTKRYIFVYFPNGVAHDYWPATGSGAAAGWTMSPLQEPLVPYKQYLQVLTNVGQTALFGGNPNPSHSQLCAPTMTGTVCDVALPKVGGPSVDQVLAQHIGMQTPFDSLQTGLSTMSSYPDGRDPSISRSISWKDASTPLYKEVNPQALFDRLVMQLGPSGNADPAAIAAGQLRKDRDIIVLDFVHEDAQSLQMKLSSSDRTRLSQFMDSVQDLETRTQLIMPGQSGQMVTVQRPTLSATYTERNGNDIKSISPNDPMGYNRDTHAEVMNDLITMAFQTDLTRVITHMLDDARSDYHYNFLKQRTFTAAGSTEVNQQLATPLNGDLLGYHALQHDGDSNDGFATVNYWLVSKFASLIDRFSKTPDPLDGTKMLIDTTFMQFQSGMQGSNHEADNLPIVLAGSGGGLFKQDYHNVFASEVPLANVHLTVLQTAFGLSDVTSFGNGTATVPELLA